MQKRTLITSALPYANGPLHFGHLAGVYLPSDIFYRHKKIMCEKTGEKVVHICGSDEHGVAIMLSAEKEGKDYQSYVDHWHQNHFELFKKYGIEFDFFGRTSAPYHKEEVIRWFDKLLKDGFIEKRPEQQLYCNHCPRFLPDRYVEGTCYVCNHTPARGDECPHCGEWIDPLKLKNPVCKICNSKDIIIKDSEHWYLLLKKLEAKFQPWFQTKKHWRSHVWQYVNSLLEKGLVDRAITRDLSWGIDVPVKGATGKKLYVWFDAPIGYVSNTKEWLKKSGLNEDYLKDWWHNPNTEILHFIGKDNIIFHGLIWPSMVLGTGFVNPPTDVPASHFVNLEGKQFSKSSGWYVDSEETIQTLGQDALRFYLTSLVPENDDTNFSWEAFLNSYNELGNKIGNFINRSMSFLAKHWPEGISGKAFEKVINSEEVVKFSALMADFQQSLDRIQIQKAHSLLLRMGEEANETFHRLEPWKTIKTDKEKAEETIALSVIYSVALNAVFQPFLPAFSKNLFAYFEKHLSQIDLNKLYSSDLKELQALLKKSFGKGYQLAVTPAPLFPKIEPKVLEPFQLKK